MMKNSIKPILLICLLWAFTGLHAQQESSLIKVKTTRIIGKIDLYWSAVMFAENFPSFFPLELEINFPKARLSAEVIASPWFREYHTQTEIFKEASFSGGIGLRYYPFKKAFPQSCTGFFVEPQLLTRYTSTTRDSITRALELNTELTIQPFVGIGYQHQFLDWLYLQGRVSVGMGQHADFKRYGLGQSLTVLPWIGLGFGLH